jgi:hypothetical protein
VIPNRTNVIGAENGDGPWSLGPTRSVWRPGRSDDQSIGWHPGRVPCLQCPSGTLAFIAGRKAGLKDVFSAENIAAMTPDLFLAFADRMAAREAARKITTKFIKEGFGKGFAAGVMGWTEVQTKPQEPSHFLSGSSYGRPGRYSTAILYSQSC